MTTFRFNDPANYQPMETETIVTIPLKLEENSFLVVRKYDKRGVLQIQYLREGVSAMNFELSSNFINPLYQALIGLGAQNEFLYKR